MSNFLNPENSVMQFLARVCDYLILNVRICPQEIF